MKAKLTFDLPDDREAFERMNKADNLCSVLYEYKEWLRAEIEDLDDDHPLFIAWNKLFELMEDKGVNLDEIWS